MNPAIQIPADQFLDQAIAALIAADAATLRQLETAASTVALPRNRTGYQARRATFAALLDVTARNLRFLHRVSGKPTVNIYTHNGD